MFMDTLQRFTSSEFNPFVIIISVKTVAVAFASFRKTVAAECHLGRKKKNNVQLLLTNIFSLFRRVGCCQSSSELIECKCPPLCVEGSDENKKKTNGILVVNGALYSL